MDDKFQWITFYHAFATRLLQYRSDRQPLIGLVRRMFESTSLKMPLLEKADESLEDIDPFTVFGLFNKQLSESNRIAIIKAFQSLCGIDAPVPSSFDGIPVVNNLKATFYGFKGDRSESDINNLWDLFESALQLADYITAADRGIFTACFDKVRAQLGIRWNITMGLYWIRPLYYLSLDSRNRWFLSNPNNFSFRYNADLAGMQTVPTGQMYLELQEACKASLHPSDTGLSSLPALTYAAWILSEKVNNEMKQKDVQSPVNTGEAVLGDERGAHYWLYAPGDQASIWDECYQSGIMAIGWDEIGDLTVYQSKDEMKLKMQELIDPNKTWKNGAQATWQFVHAVQPGDIIFVKKGLHTIIGKGIVTSDYRFDADRSHYKNVHSVQWTHKGEWPHPGQAVMKTLTDITAYTDYVAKLNSLFISTDIEEESEPVLISDASAESPHLIYTSGDFLRQVYMDEQSYNTLVSLIRTKKNVILQGAPGVGKTYAAKRLAYSMMGKKDADRVMMVQFHQSYSYEDFVMGYRPSENGFELKHGAFYSFCKKAEEDSENEYFFIIDEINRGNLSKIFGELFMLIENDKRGVSLKLLYADELFSVPKNVYIIGLMNTADRSLAILDYALRRRFAFFELKPGFDSEGFRAYRDSLNSPKFDKLIQRVEALNQAIATDESLGEGFCIGHSYFSNLETADTNALSNIVEYELIPLLKEYWFDEPTNVKKWMDELRYAIK